MIFYVTSDPRRGGLAPVLPALRGLVTPLAYGRVLDARRLGAGTYLFAGSSGSLRRMRRAPRRCGTSWRGRGCVL